MKKTNGLQQLTDRQAKGGLVKVVSMNDRTSIVYFVWDKKKEEFTVKTSELSMLENNHAEFRMKNTIGAQYLTDRHADGGLVRVVSMNNKTAVVYYVRDKKKKEFTVSSSDLYILED